MQKVAAGEMHVSAASRSEPPAKSTIECVKFSLKVPGCDRRGPALSAIDWSTTYIKQVTKAGH